MSEPKTVLDIADLPVRTGSGYPEHYAKAVKGRSNVSIRARSMVFPTPLAFERR
jgi:hypothetical protein